MNHLFVSTKQQDVAESRSDFIQRSASVLTHPGTLVALAVLLANDLLFKSLWPHAWFTGKLSDLAWLVLALPLLAFLLSLLVRVRLCSPRAAFLAAYLGLPLLYLAFNSFHAVHYWILRGISVASGGTSGSPQDMTDSLVIPIGWAVALWVWRRPSVPTHKLRMRLAMLVAAVASLASVATSYPEPNYGVTNVALVEDGSLYANINWGETTWAYISDDGGFSWRQKESRRFPVSPGADAVDTPRGRYVLEGPDIVLVRNDGAWRRVVYSTAFLKKPGNVWVQEQATSGLDARRLARQPSSIVYHPGTGNVVAALGIQGALVGTPNGRWIHVTVDAMTPSDFTFAGKTHRLLTNPGFLAVAVILSLSMTGMGLILAQLHHLNWEIPFNPVGGLLVGLVVAGLLLVGIIPGFFVLIPSLLLPALLLGPLVLAIAIGSMRRQDRGRNVFTLGIGVVSAGFAGVLLFIFGGSDTEPGSMYNFWFGGIATLTCLMTLASLAVSWQLMKHWRLAAASLLAMFFLTLLPFMLWLHLGIALLLAKASAVVLTSVAALALANQMRRRLKAYDTPCHKCGSMNPPESWLCGRCGASVGQEVAPQTKLGIPGLRGRLLAGFGRRFGAGLLDLMVIYVIQIVLTSGILGGGFYTVLGWEPAIGILSGLSAYAVYALYFYLPGVAYGCLLVRLHNATAGKRLLRLQVLRTDGSRVGWSRAFLRELVRLSPLLLVSVFMVALRNDKRGLHDLISDTIVVENL